MRRLSIYYIIAKVVWDNSAGLSAKKTLPLDANDDNNSESDIRYEENKDRNN